MKLLGLEFPVPSHSVAANHVLGAAAVTIGFGIGSWLLGTPLDRPGAIALFVGCLYIKVADPFLAMKDERRKRYAVAAGGAGILVASAALVEQFAIF
jgi:hypothetical protein